MMRPWVASAFSCLNTRWLVATVAKWVLRIKFAFMSRFSASQPPTFCIASVKHRRWMQPLLESMGWCSGSSSNAAFYWRLSKKLLPESEGAIAFNCLPNMLLLDDKAVLALLTRCFTRTRPLITHVLYGEWDGAPLHLPDAYCQHTL